LKKVITVLGARPQFIKAAPLSKVLRTQFTEKIVHTGQHYDHSMSNVFFEEMGIPAPDYYLGVGSKNHGAQTGEMLAGVEEILLQENPDWVLVYGDTNSTLAGALAAAKLHIPVAHVEAGLRSFNKQMPEEINRILTDQVSSLLFCPTGQAVENLESEGITKGVFRTGDVMADAFMFFMQRAQELGIGEKFTFQPKTYFLATIHRAENTDNLDRLREIFTAFGQIKGQIVLPLHPRTKKILENSNLHVPSNVQIIHPVGYLEMVWLEQGANLILTDSGGVQKEAYLSRVPCVTLRDQTEWVETLEIGWNTLAGAKAAKIVQAVDKYRSNPMPTYIENIYGEGKTSEQIVAVMAGSRTKE
jgi:UDP-GlcNAc3NAcA epimerase